MIGFGLTNANWKCRIVADAAEKPLALTILIGFYIIVCCVSLVYLPHFKYPGFFNANAFHIFYDSTRLLNVTTVIAAFAVISLLFSFARFSFGYLVGFYLYTVILGYLWLNCFSDLNYNHQLTGLSAAASATAFLLPALLITSPIKQTWVLSEPAFERLITLLALVIAATIVIGSIYNFRFVAIKDIYEFRGKLEFPTLLRYSLGMTSGALLPFVFSCFLERRKHWRAGAVLLAALLFYPITLSKLTLFTPAWLLFTAILARIFRAKATVILSLFLPVLAGILSAALKVWPAFFYIVNFRMIAIPSNAIDIYNHYFSSHDLTYFCQIAILKTLAPCSFQSDLSVVMQDTYHLGYFNASLFATEGIASVGPLFAPVTGFLCGLVFALGNRLSAGLPSRFILVSGAIVPQVLLNVPLSTALLTHGLGLLFLLWYITPRGIFEPNAIERTRDDQ
jgi:hypothetical protein